MTKHFFYKSIMLRKILSVFIIIILGISILHLDLGFNNANAENRENLDKYQLNIHLQVNNPTKIARKEPITSGLPIPKKFNIIEVKDLQLLDDKDELVHSQFTPLARWGAKPGNTNAPIKWVLVDFQAYVQPGGTRDYFVRYGYYKTGPEISNKNSLIIKNTTNKITVDTGVANFSISKIDGSFSAPELVKPIYSRLQLSNGKTYNSTGPVNVSVKLRGEMRCSINVKGTYGSDIDYSCRFWFYSGLSTIRMFHTFENNKLAPLDEYEQIHCYDIWSENSVNISDLSIIIPTNFTDNIEYIAGGNGNYVMGDLTDDLVVYQDSSGTKNWNLYPTMLDWEGEPLITKPRMQSYVSFHGYKTTVGSSIIDNGDQAEGWVSVGGDEKRWIFGVRDFWQNFPKALRATTNGIVEIGLFPTEFGTDNYNFNFRSGEHKTHELWLCLQNANEDIPAIMSNQPLFAKATPSWYVNSGAFGPLALPNNTAWPEHEQYIKYQIETSPEHEGFEDYFENIPDAIEGTDHYGIFDYGDWPQDYEGFEVAPLNCKYDNDYGMWLQWARGSNSKWFELAEAADRHFADLDILHNLHSPRHWSDGIAFGHSYHDEDGFINPHRNYGGNHPDTAYGMNGMMITYYLTGYEKAYESAIELADCIEHRVHNDVNVMDFYPEGENSGDGYALGAGMYDAGCRPAANSLSILVTAYRVTGDERYLKAAEAIVDYAQANKQPYMNGPTGQDQMMRPWMLNMYLKALASFIEILDEYNITDTYYAKESYLTYVNWLHEYPWIQITNITTGKRAAYPYEWWFDNRSGIDGDENDNSDPSINNWLLLGADAMSYGFHLSGDKKYLVWAEELFRTGTHDPWYEDDKLFYSETKQTINSITYGHLFLYEWGKVNTIIDDESPFADAGLDQTIKQNQMVTLNASRSTDNVLIMNYTWTFSYVDSSITLYGKIVQFIFELPGKYEIRLIVYDKEGNMDTDNVIINVNKHSEEPNNKTENFSISIGPILDENNEPVKDVTVNLSRNKIEFSAESNSSGIVNINNIIEGQYNCTMMKNDVKLNFLLTVNSTGIVNYTLPTFPTQAEENGVTKPEEEGDNGNMYIFYIIVVVIIILIMIFIVRWITIRDRKKKGK